MLSNLCALMWKIRVSVPQGAKSHKSHDSGQLKVLASGGTMLIPSEWKIIHALNVWMHLRSARENFPVQVELFLWWKCSSYQNLQAFAQWGNESWPGHPHLWLLHCEYPNPWLVWPQQRQHLCPLCPLATPRWQCIEADPEIDRLDLSRGFFEAADSIFPRSIHGNSSEKENRKTQPNKKKPLSLCCSGTSDPREMDRLINFKQAPNPLQGKNLLIDDHRSATTLWAVECQIKRWILPPD